MEQRERSDDETNRHPSKPGGAAPEPRIHASGHRGGDVRTIYIGGQNAVSPEGKVVGDDLATQTEQVFDNLETIPAAAGATLRDVVKWTISVMQGQDIRPGLGVFQRRWGRTPTPRRSAC